jgi:hypothetical protein
MEDSNRDKPVPNSITKIVKVAWALMVGGHRSNYSATDLSSSQIRRAPFAHTTAAKCPAQNSRPALQIRIWLHTTLGALSD